MAVQSFPMSGGAHNRHTLCEWQEASIRLKCKSRPVSCMFFRPEEVDPASSAGEISAPVSNRDVNIGTDALRVLAFDDTFTHHHLHRISAVQTGRLDHDCLPREKPADR